MRLRRVLVSVAVVAALGTTGCSASGADDDSDTDAAPAGATATAGAAERTTAAAGATAAADETTDAAAAEDVCAHLTEELPRIKAVGSEVGAMAQLTMSLAGFYENHGKVADGTVLDAQTEKACPRVRTEILEAAGIKSFADL
jgi:hypothetical protein